jgi:glutamate-ammonia-ligase adenylyltransferase
MVRDAQTHRLPDEAQERDRIACHLGLASREALAGELSRMRSRVVAQFAAAVVGEAAGAASPDGFQDLVEGRRGRAELVAWLSTQGLRDAEELAQMLESMHAAGWYTRLTQAARARLQELLPRCLAVAAALDADAQTMRRVLDVLAAVGSRSVYFALLSENRQALEHLLRVCRMGPLIAEQLVRTPALLDALVDPALLAQPPAPADLRDDLERQLAALAEGDDEGTLDAMRYFQRQALFQIGVADLLDLIDVSQVSDLLTALAELLLAHALRVARGQLDARYGRPRDAQGDPVPFTIFAYGKLGGRELGYGSDLDVVFLHGDAPGPTDGDRPLDGEVYFRRLAQRVIHVLSTQTGAGSLYQVDTRLRPSGNAGLLVTSLSAFATYQESQAWTWEHQALLRARPVAGDAVLCERVEAVRRRVLCRPREREALRHDVLAMRERMRSAAGAVASPGCFDLKRDPGGLVDLEFIVQYLVLARAQQHPQLVEGRDNASQLRLLGALGVLDPLQADALAQAYHRLRGLAHRAALRGEARPIASLDEAQDAAGLIADAFARIFEAGDASV